MNAGDLIKKGNQLKRQGKISNAKNCYIQSIEINPNFAWSHYYLAEVLDIEGNSKQAIEECNYAINIKPNSSFFNYYLGKLLLKIKEVDKAIYYLQKAISLKPSLAIFYINLGHAFAELNDLNNALQNYQLGIKFNSTYNYCDLAIKLIESGKIDIAIEILKIAIQLNPNDYKHYEQLGMVLAKKGNLSEAIKYLEIAIKINPFLTHVQSIISNKKEIDIKTISYPNLALNKPTAQSSIYKPEIYGYDAHAACNGNKTGKFSFHTLKENQPWWQIDLGHICSLSVIRVFNRLDFKERASTLNILLSDDSQNWLLIYSNDRNNIFGGIDGKPLVIDLQNQTGRYVRLQLRDNNISLHLDEVEIYGVPLKEDQISKEILKDEATLYKNFYNDVSLPLPTPTIKMLIARRLDGLGTRLMSILSARYASEYFKCQMCITWPTIGSRYYPSNILRDDSIVEIFQDGKVFKDFDVNCLSEKEYSKLNTKSLNQIKGGRGKNGYFVLINRDITANFAQCEFITYDEPWAIVPYGIKQSEVSLKIKEYWKNLNWHKSILDSITLFKDQIKDNPYIVTHIRRGDIIHRLLHDNLKDLNDSIEAIFGRYLPVATASQLIIESGFKNVVICSECNKSTQILTNKVNEIDNQINFYISSDFTENLTENQIATYDMIVMSLSHKIFTSYSSSFSTCAEFSGNTLKAKIDTDWENMATELIEYIDKNNNEMTSERKSLICLHISKKIKDREKADYYANLSQSFSFETFKKFS